jgi:hypothetical protein
MAAFPLSHIFTVWRRNRRSLCSNSANLRLESSGMSGLLDSHKLIFRSGVLVARYLDAGHLLRCIHDSELCAPALLRD